MTGRQLDVLKRTYTLVESTLVRTMPHFVAVETARSQTEARSVALDLAPPAREVLDVHCAIALFELAIEQVLDAEHGCVLNCRRNVPN